MGKPDFLYKYRSIKNHKDLVNDHSLDALFKCYSVFSNRKNFNDLFDTKIAIGNLSPKDFNKFISKLPRTSRKFMSKHIKNGKYTTDGKQFLDEFKIEINRIIDTRAIFSLTSKNDCNLMWGHYADSHNGFCIEFKSDKMPVEKICYKSEIAELEFVDFLNFHFGLVPEIEIGKKIMKSLTRKLEEWKYEDEYRLIASKTLGVIKPGEKFIKVNYSEDFINSIIFGVRMEKDIKKYILNNLPYKTSFKQAIEETSKVKIVEFNQDKHL